MKDCVVNAKQEMSTQFIAPFCWRNCQACQNPRTTMKPLLLCACLAVLTTTHAAVQMPSIFTDHMVLQRDLPVPVRGKASPAEDAEARYIRITNLDHHDKLSGEFPNTFAFTMANLPPRT